MKNPNEYYRYGTDESFRALETTPEGLIDDEVKKRLEFYGQNKLPDARKESVFLKALHQVKDLMVVILLVAGALSVYMEDYNSAVVLFLIVVINTSIGFFQEYKAEKIMNSIKMMIHPKAKVIRNGKLAEINSSDLVPGDIVELEEGDSVPADLRIFEQNELATNDFALTGESNPTRKFSHAIDGAVEIGDRNNLTFMGTTVAIGNGRGIVIATGIQTEIGKIAHLSQQEGNDLSPLQKELNHLAKKLTLVTAVIAGAMLLIALGVNFNLKEAFIFAVGIASCMVPQGLPAEVSIALSLASSRLAEKKAIIKKLSAVETLGATHIICTDKTGTLTKNEMTVEKILIGSNEFSVTGPGYEPKGNILNKSGGKLNTENFKLFFETGVLASNARINPPDSEHKSWYAIGDPTEAALITLGQKIGLDPKLMDKESPELREFTFDAVRKRMSSVRKHNGKIILFAKGSVQSLLERCDTFWDGEKIRKITDDDKTFIQVKDDEFATQALRVIAFGYKEFESYSDKTTMESAEQNLTFLGLAAMIDPPREEVKEAMDIAAKAHIRVIIITGDYALTAKAIAKKIGLGGQGGDSSVTIVTGKELEAMSDIAVLHELIHSNLIFARTSPENKLRIVDLLKKAGEIVAVTGDGVNDSPALKKADIGVAMGKTGTEVAKDSAEIILLDDSFGTLISAIQEGRTIFRNIGKTVRANLTTNTGELTVVLLSLIASALFNLPLAILTLQILAIDLVGQILPITALTWDPTEESIMTEAPRNTNEHIFNKKTLKTIVWSGGLMGLIAYANFLLLFARNDIPLTGLTSANALYPRAMTITYATLVAVSFMNMLSKRVGSTETVFTSYLWANRRLLLSFVVSLGLVLLLIYGSKFNAFLQTSPLNISDWLYVLLGAVAYLLIYESIKLVGRLRKK